jgi:hypothetical protein
MITDMYQEYLYVIGKLKDVFKLDVIVDHKDIHTFFMGKKPLFKLIYGIFSEDKDPSIVVSFHLDLHHPEAINWYIQIYKIHPFTSIHDSHVEDSNGETYLGEDALAIREVYRSQEILGKWLESSSREEIKEFTEAKVNGRKRNPNQVFDSQVQKDEAIIEFERIRKPPSEDDVH